MEKREFMEQAWIHISKRLPKECDNMSVLVLTYNSVTGFMAVFPAPMAREYAQRCLDGDTEVLSWDRYITHWMPLYAPENCFTYEQRQSQARTKKKR